MKLIETIRDRCHECYACIRNCPVKAVRVQNGQAEVINDRCINCANCVNICSQGAKIVKDFGQTIEDLLKSNKKVVAGLAPSFPAYNKNYDYSDWENFLLELGFAEVYEVAWGAQLMIEEYKNHLAESDDMVISTACPVVVNYVEKYYPELIQYLAPIVSPMGALVKYIEEVEGSEVRMVIIGPCHAKKHEFAENHNVTVATFTEIAEMGEGFKLSPGNASKSVFKNGGRDTSGSGPDGFARKIPLAGGLLEALEGTNSDDFIKVEGQEKIYELFELLVNEELEVKFIDMLFCEGCISGVDLADESYFKKRKAVHKFIEKSMPGENTKYIPEKITALDLSRSYSKDFQQLPQPGEDEIWEILNQTNKFTEDDLLNCGACGYNSCREKAIAVYQGLAEVEMCLPYLLSDKRSEIRKVQELNRELDNLINSSYDGMIVVDGKGIVERVNDAYLEMIGLARDNLVGKNVDELEQKRIIYPSVSKLSIREKRNITLVQNTSSGKRILVTAKPIIGNDKVIRIIINARDLSELDMAVGNSEEQNKLRVYLENESDHINSDSTGHIISKSNAMKNILRTASKIGDTDSTVLITGDSGVGKEVVARYIHDQSEKREDFVKINCAAIPERLLESELFGYETGAFSGARREGKSGLIEKADDGTLFLDEIAEMPLNMQAKLLQVIQEHRVTRIGGVEPIAVNFRLITATNRNLKQMVAQGEFRQDLFYRLNVVPIDIPPLRERKDDIKPLIVYFTAQLNKKYNKNVEFTADAEKMLIEYEWPGNVRELINLLERVIVTTEGELIDGEFLKNFFHKDTEEETDVKVNGIMPLKEAVARVEKKLLVMAKEEGKTTYEMARMLGVNQSTVVRKMKKYFE